MVGFGDSEDPRAWLGNEPGDGVSSAASSKGVL